MFGDVSRSSIRCQREGSRYSPSSEAALFPRRASIAQSLPTNEFEQRNARDPERVAHVGNPRCGWLALLLAYDHGLIYAGERDDEGVCTGSPRMNKAAVVAQDYADLNLDRLVERNEQIAEVADEAEYLIVFGFKLPLYDLSCANIARRDERGQVPIPECLDDLVREDSPETFD